MRRAFQVGLSVAILVAPLALVTASTTNSSVATSRSVPQNPTVRVAGPQHWCGTNGIDLHRAGARTGTSTPATTRRSQHGRAHHAATSATTSRRRCSTRTAPARATTSPTSCGCPRTRRRGPGRTAAAAPTASSCIPRSGSAWSCATTRARRTRTARRSTGHATVPCKPDSDTNIYASPNPNSPHYFGLGPGQALHGDAVLPAGLGAVAGRHRLHRHAVVRRAEHRHVLQNDEHRARSTTTTA